jgi:hypothetical protein
MKALAGLVLLAILVAGGFFGYQTLFAPKPQPQSATPGATQSAKNAASFDQKVGALQTLVESGSKQEVTMELTQDEVNAKVAQELSSASGNLPVKDVTVKLQQGSAVVTGVASLGGQEVPVEAQVKVGTNGGLLDVNVTSLKAAGVPVPDPVKEQLVQQAEAAMGGKDLSALDVGIDLKSVQLSDGKVVVNGQAR